MSALAQSLAFSAISAITVSGWAADGACSVRSAARLTPVLELYTSEGCSSCPPADHWLSRLQPAQASGQAVVQAFHVGYWDALGWVDRFAAPAHTTRQRQLAAANGLPSIYTPQIVRNGRDWRTWPDGGQALAGEEPPQATLNLTRLAHSPQGDQFEASVVPTAGAPATWAAYWTVTEHGHSSRVQAGENAGEWLRHDFVVRQYTPAGEHSGPARLGFRSRPADPAHPQQINLVVYQARTERVLQAVSLSCGG